MMHTARKGHKAWAAGILWCVLAALMMAVLRPCFSMFWNGRAQMRIARECELLADAVLKQSVVEQARSRKNDMFLRTYLFALNALAGWTYSYGGTDRQEIAAIYDLPAYSPDGIAVLQGGAYHVLHGAFPRNEFDEALRQRKLGRRTVASIVKAQKSALSFTANVDPSATTSFLTENDGTMYLSAELPHAGTVVISKIPYLPELYGELEADLDLHALAGSLLSNPEIGIALVRLSDHVVVLAGGDLDIREGETLEEEPDENSFLKIGDTWYIAGTAEDFEYRVYVASPAAGLFSGITAFPTALALIFTILFLMTGLYAAFLRTDFLRGRVEGEPGSAGSQGFSSAVLFRHVRLVFYMMALGVSVLILLACALQAIDIARVRGDRILSEIERYFDSDDEYVDTLTSTQREQKLSFLNISRDLIEAVPERRTDKALEDLSGAIERDLFLLDQNGVVTASSEQNYDFSALSDPESGLYGLASVLEGKADHEAAAIAGEGMSPRLCWAIRCKNIGGMLVSVDNLAQAISSANYYADYKMPPELALFVIDLKTGEILSASDEAYYGKDAKSIGLSDEVCQDGFSADIMINGKSYFVQTCVHKARADVVAADLGYLARMYLPRALAAIVAGLGAARLILALAFRLQKGFWLGLPPMAEDGDGMRASGQEPPVQAGGRQGENHAEFYREQDGSLRTNRSAVGRWLELSTPFGRQSADEKLRTVLCYAFIAFLLMGFTVYQGRSASEQMGSAIAYLLQRSWHYGLNIYAISYAVFIFCLILVAGRLLRRLVLTFGERMGSRGETIARLMSSFIAYASAFLGLGYGLVFLGVDTTALLASAGIIGLGISIGARDLIADILAGIAIVFEGEFRTGDIIEINGYRGTVEEIGIRTTKVMSQQNVKIFRNSNISGVVNMTQRHSIAQARISVSRAEPLEKAEAVFRDALPGIRAKIPQAMSDIVLRGVEQLNDRAVILEFDTECAEADRQLVESLLLRELDLLMQRENIAST